MTLIIMKIINAGDITCNDITYNINKCDITYIFATMVSRVI